MESSIFKQRESLMAKIIDSNLYVKATGELELEVKRELVMPDPDKATAMDLLEGADEDSEGDD